MRILPLSDIHLEFGKMRVDVDPALYDVVVLAGDISPGVAGIIWAAQTFDKPVIYVPGNHEFYGKREYYPHINKMKKKAHETANVQVLHNDVVYVDNVRFFGSTLWTDFDLFGTWPLSIAKAQADMNDYEQIMLKSWPKVAFTAEDSRKIHTESVFCAHEVLRMPWLVGPSIVVTHHAPSSLSIAEKYRFDALSPAYASRLEELIAVTSPDLWIHGHIHNSQDYQLYDTRVVCNPRGYAGHELNPNFNPSLIIEV